MNEFKIAVISKDGDAKYYPIDDNDTYHAYYLELYAKEHYQLPDNVDTRSANSIALFLRNQGNVVFLNITTYKENILKQHGRNGIIIIPDIITDQQEKAILELNDNIQNFDSIQIWHNFISETDCSMTVRHTNEEVRKLLPGFLEYYKENQNARKSK